MFHCWGLQVEGADLSPAMIDRARAMFGEPAGLRWAVRGFDQAIAPAEPFDAAVCVGNSLPLVDDLPTVQRAIEQMLAAVRPGGLVVVHALNIWRLPDGPCVWQKCRRTTLPQGEVMIVKGVHRSQAIGYVELIVAGLSGEAEVPMRTECVPFFGLEAADLEQFARTAGATDVRFLGGYRNEPFDRAKSIDLLMVAKK
jgi:SAM-dependent methyltransferase